MPTTRTRYIHTNSTAGGDGTTNATTGVSRAYATMAAAVTAEAGNITAATGTDEIVEFLCSGTVEDTAAVTDAGWTTAAANYVVFRANTGQEAPAVWDTSRHRRGYLSVSYGVDLTNIGHVRFERMQIGLDSSTGLTCGALKWEPGAADASSYLVLDGCAIRLAGGGSGGRFVVRTRHSAGTALLRNCLIYQAAGAGNTGGSPSALVINSPGTGTGYMTIHNCTFHANGFARCINRHTTNSLITARNTLATGGAVADFADLTATEYCASGDTTATGTGSRISQTFTFANAAGDDYRITSGDAGAQDFGTDLSLDATLPVTTDFEGTARPQGAAFDIGFYEVAGASGVTGTGTAAFALASTATGESGAVVLGTATFTLASSATGTSRTNATGTASFTLASTATGTQALAGTGTAVFTLAASGTATGRTTASGSAVFTLAVTASNVAGSSGLLCPVVGLTPRYTPTVGLTPRYTPVVTLKSRCI